MRDVLERDVRKRDVLERDVRKRDVLKRDVRERDFRPHRNPERGLDASLEARRLASLPLPDASPDGACLLGRQPTTAVPFHTLQETVARLGGEVVDSRGATLEEIFLALVGHRRHAEAA